MAQGARRPPRFQRHSRTGTRFAISSNNTSPQRSARQLKNNNDDFSNAEIIAIISDMPSEKLTSLSDAAEALLKPITGHQDLDRELYAFIATILKLCILSWYEIITTDKQMNGELVSIIIYGIQIVQQRLRTIDLNALLLDELPSLVEDHIKAVSLAKDSSTSQDDFKSVFHAIRPHPALHPVPVTSADTAAQRENEVAWCQAVVSKLLSHLLPADDMQNPGLAVLVSEIFSEMIMLNGVCGKVAEPWFLWESISRALLVLRPHPTARDNGSQPGLQATKTTKDADSWLWTSLNGLRLLLNFESWTRALRLIQRPVQSITSIVWTARAMPSASAADPQSVAKKDDSITRRPLLKAKIWTCAAHLTDIQQRMPWLAASLSLVQWCMLHGPGMVGGNGSTLDRWLQAEIDARLYDISLWPGVLKITRQSLFPGGAFAPARPAPDAAEVNTIRQACARSVHDSVAPSVRKVYFGSTDDLKDVDVALSFLEDAYVNKALIISIVELIITRLFPELV